MDPKDKAINQLIMQEIGLEIGDRQRVYDQDTGCILKIDGMEMVAPGCYGGKQAVEFDPYNNRKMMSQLFSYYVDKQADEGGSEVIAFYNIDPGGRMECRLDDNTTVTSNRYLRDTLKYTDLIMRMNGEENPNLKEYDYEPKEPTVVKKKQPAKGKGKKTNGRKKD